MRQQRKKPMGSPDLFCVDVFDTILTRMVGSPVWLFYVLGQRLLQLDLIPISPDRFMQNRVAAEQLARLAQAKNEVSFDRIWDRIANDLVLSVDTRKLCMDEELRLEDELIRPVPDARDLIMALAQRGKVAFLSDMYLPAAFIKGQLQKHGLWPNECALYVSAEYGCSKRDGSLFREVLAREGIVARRARHIGNDAVSDGRGARAARLRVNLDTRCTLNRYEQILQEAASETDGVGSFMAGASRLARLRASNGDAQCRALWEVAAGVAAPTLTAYVIWLFQRAHDLGIRRLYFVSRDGQILMEIARQLSAKWNLDFELRYLYGSRQAWHLPALSAVNERELSWMLTYTTFLSVETAFARVCIEPEYADAQLTKNGFRKEDWQRNLKSAERERLRAVFSDPSVSQKIIAEAQKRRSIVVRYLKQEGLFDCTPSAIIDVGLTGKTLDSLSALFHDKGVRAVPYGFFFGLVADVSNVEPVRSPREGFYVDSHRGKSEPVTLEHRNTMLEMFCAGDHGQVCSYAERGGIVEPVLKEPTNALVLKWGLTEVRKAVSAFVKEFEWQRSAISDFQPLGRVIGKAMKEFWSHPTYQEAHAWGSFPYIDDQTEAYWKPLAEPFTILDVSHAARGRVIQKHIHSWNAASGILTSVSLRAGMRSASVCAPYYRRLREIIGTKLGL
jgi:FMN phosphatase YigB (HAD superfamily)